MERPWISIKELADLFGLTLGSLRNAIAEDRFPIPTYKLGKRVVADKHVVEQFFASRRADGLKQITRRA
jgi:predicted DNA-binding transcriptional regulator AlpA